MLGEEVGGIGEHSYKRFRDLIPRFLGDSSCQEQMVPCLLHHSLPAYAQRIRSRQLTRVYSSDLVRRRQKNLSILTMPWMRLMAAVWSKSNSRRFAFVEEDAGTTSRRLCMLLSNVGILPSKLRIRIYGMYIWFKVAWRAAQIFAGCTNFDTNSRTREGWVFVNKTDQDSNSRRAAQMRKQKQS